MMGFINWIQGIKHHFLSSKAEVESELTKEEMRIKSRLKIEKMIMDAANNDPDLYDRLMHAAITSGDIKGPRVDKFREDSQHRKAETIIKFFNNIGEKNIKKYEALLEDMTK